MATRMTTQPPPSVYYDERGRRLTILPDPSRYREPELMEQFPILAMIVLALRAFFRGEEDVLMSGEGYLCETGDSYSDRFVPDIVFARVENPRTIEHIQNGYVIDEVGKPPDLVLEVASESTGRRDYTFKRDGYQRMGVGEYWRFDPSGGDWHDAALAGDLLVDGVYQPIEVHREADGSVWGRSEALGLDIYWVESDGGDSEGVPRFYDYQRGEFLPEYEELVDQRDEERSGRLLAEAQAESESKARAEAEARAESESRARAEAEARARAAEAELQRLRRASSDRD